MREIIIEKNDELKSELSNDLGAFAGLLFDVGEKKLLISDDHLSDEERTKIEKKNDALLFDAVTGKRSKKAALLKKTVR